MITREQSFRAAKALAKGTWEHLPAILAMIPATAVAGKVLTEIKKIGDEVKASGQLQEKQLEVMQQLAEENGGKAEFERKVREELKAEKNPKNPAYINCAIFVASTGSQLSKDEQENIIDTLMGQADAKTDEIARFVDAFREDYFGDDYEACDNAIEIDSGYIEFNFDDMTDHVYDEEDLELICDMLNKIAGRKVFDEYEGLGTDDSCDY